jgi:bacillolysin
MRSTVILLTALLFGGMNATAQNKQKVKRLGSIDAESLPLMQRAHTGTPLSNNLFTKTYQRKMLTEPINLARIPFGFRVLSSENGVPTLLEGSFPYSKLPEGADIKARSLEYLEGLRKAMRLDNPSNEFEATDVSTDALGQTHIRLQQKFNQIKVWNGNVVVHEVDGKIAAMNGRWFPTPTLSVLTPSVSESEAKTFVSTAIQKTRPFQKLSDKNKKLIHGEQLRPELVIYHQNNDASDPKLVWHITAFPNVMQRYEYFVDATTGETLHSYNHTCDFHGGLDSEKPMVEKPPLDGAITANLLDANGVMRSLGLYGVVTPRVDAKAGLYFADISRSMYKPDQSNMPDEPVGAIWTLNAFNTSPNDQSFNYDHVYGATAAAFAQIPIGVSAHYNSGQAYTYYKNTFNRNSINGKGGTVISMVNVSEDNGAGMDNAYWNGEAMFYGNGGKYFTPLAKALDVAGHEISHGVVQNTANLEYQGEAGAMNESFADIFGSMIDRNNWTMGEGVVVKQYFPTGALRDLSNPHNGGVKGDNGWQPANMSEKYNGSVDNGGVHINSGITNYAYYLFATHAAVGKDKAEQVFYRSLTTYLVARSNFKDLRASVEKSCADLYPNNTAVLAAAQNAFAQVGIGGGGDPGGVTYQQDLPVNPGDELLLYSALDSSKIYLMQNGVSYKISDTKHISKPSVSDKGDEIVFVAQDSMIHYIKIQWQGQTANRDPEYTFTKWGKGWDNVVISKDGSKLAATKDVSNVAANIIYIYNDNLDRWKPYTLYNPTNTEKVNNYNVRFPDALEWDHEGEEVMYDAQSSFKSTSGLNIYYWDIGFLKAWDNTANDFGSGKVEKLFRSLPASTNVGNPTFSKNSPHIIAFDYIDGSDPNYVDMQVWGANTESGVFDTIYLNTMIGNPSFSKLDDKVLFNAYSPTTNNKVLGYKALTTNKLQGTGKTFVLQNPGYWGTWFANGARRLVDVQEISEQMTVQLFPNPTYDRATLEFHSTISATGMATVYNLMGQHLWTLPLQITAGLNQIPIEMANLNAGQYFVRLDFGAKQNVLKITKF